MVDSGLGRHDVQLGNHGFEARPFAEPDDRDVREPRADLPPVHAAAFEADVKILGEGGRRPVRVVEHEHADTARLAVPAREEQGGSSGHGGEMELAGDCVDLGGRPGAEEGERDVELLGPDDPDPIDVREPLLLPGGEAGESVGGKPEGAEQAEPFIAWVPPLGEHAEPFITLRG